MTRQTWDSGSRGGLTQVFGLWTRQTPHLIDQQREVSSCAAEDTEALEHTGGGEDENTDKCELGVEHHTPMATHSGAFLKL